MFASGSKSPIIFDLVNNFASVAASNFLNDLNAAKEQEQKELAEEGLEDDTPTFNVFDETKDIRLILEEIEAKFQTWEFWFQLLNEWKNDKTANKKSDSHVPMKKVYRGYKLGFWYDNQRANKERLQNVFPNRYKKLIDYGIRWRDEPFRSKVTLLEGLREKMPLLKEYFRLNKTANIPRRLNTANKLGHIGWDRKLALYVHHALRAKHMDRILSDATLTYFDDGIEIPIKDYLEKINFEIDIKPKVASLMIERLKEERKKNPSFNQEDFNNLLLKDKKFGRSVNKLRNHMNDLEDNPISYFAPGEIDELLSLGFTPARKVIAWEDRYNDLKLIYIKNQNKNCKFKQTENWGFYMWCKKQVHEKHLLSKDQIEKLNAIKFFETWETKHTNQREGQEKRFKANVEMMLKNYELTGSYRGEKRSKVENFWLTLLEDGVSLDRVEYLKSKGFDIEEQRKLRKKRGRK